MGDKTSVDLLEYELVFFKAIKSATKYNVDKEIKLYRVGGFVRDMIIGVESKDVDYLVTNVSYEDLQDTLNKHFDKVISTSVGDDMNVIKVAMPNGEIYDFAIPRKDLYGNTGKHTDLKTIGDPSMDVIDDLSRRDFTMNAIAYDVETHEYVDPYNGRKDIECKVIKCVGDANIRFREDALRILRAIQFSVRFDFSINIATKYGIINNQDLLDKISKERIYTELEKAFTKSKNRGNKKLLKLLELISSHIFKSDEYSPIVIDCFQGDLVISNYVAMFINDDGYKDLKLPRRTIQIIDICRDIVRNPYDDYVFHLLYKKEHLLYNVYDALSPKEYDRYLKHTGLDLTKIITKPMTPKDLKITSEELIELGVPLVELGKLAKNMAMAIYLDIIKNEHEELVNMVFDYLKQIILPCQISQNHLI